MVGNQPVDKPTSDKFDLAAALLREYPELVKVAAAAGQTPLYVVGGALRDLFAGRGRSDLDLAVEGDPGPVLERLGGELPKSHDRFQTASVTLDGLRIDFARTRRESYERPGALPEVEPATIAEDLARRDLTVNAMACRVPGTGSAAAVELLDPFGGREDLAAGRLRFLHAESLRDDPTRALRAARYAASYGLSPDADAQRQLAAADLSTVSWERRRADLIRILEDPAAPDALALLEHWGIPGLRRGWRERLQAVDSLLAGPPWWGSVAANEARLAAVWDEALPQGPPGPPRDELTTDAARAIWAERQDPLALLLLRAEGLEWLDDYMERLRHIRLEIGGQDLLEAGVPRGPAVGRGLAAALAAKRNGEVAGRKEELAVALAAARAGG